MTNIRDISDKGRKQGKSLRYEVGYYCKPCPDTSDEQPEIIAKFKRHGDAYRFAQLVAVSPDATLVLIRS
jgi:hypothetical protein